MNYQEGTGPSGPREAAYFDKVDRITADQDYMLQLWGQLTRIENGGAVIDSFIQVPFTPSRFSGEADLTLPKAMGGGVLTARLEANRIRVQTLKLNDGDITLIRDVAGQVAALRGTPDQDAQITGRLQEDGLNRGYSIVGSEGSWVQLAFEGGGGGWTSVDEFCVAACRRLLDVADYANEIADIASGTGSASRFPESVTAEARDLGLKMVAMKFLDENPSAALEVLQSSSVNERDKSVLGSTDLSNLTALAKVSSSIRQKQGDGGYDSVRLDQSEITRITEDLARTSVADPRSIYTLENLKVLFGYTGDKERQSIAADIISSLK
ncbi:hypothetical protein ACCS78_30190 [Rhizobium johnstonii]